MVLQAENFSYLATEKDALGNPIDSGFQPGFQKVFSAPVSEKASNAQPAAPVEVAPVFTEKDLADSRLKGYEEGYAKGYSAAKSLADETNAKIEENLKAIDKQLVKIIEERKLDELKQGKDLAEMAVRIAKKVADSALVGNPAAEIEKIIIKSFALLFDEPKIVININSNLVDEIQKRIDSLVKKEGFGGQVEIKGGDIPMGSCEIEWKGGGVKSNKNDVWDEINKMCDYLL